MRLDHLLSKEEEVGVGLLFKCQSFSKKRFDRGPRSSAEPSGIDRGSRPKDKLDKLPVAMRSGDTPVLIPNTMVKT